MSPTEVMLYQHHMLAEITLGMLVGVPHVCAHVVQQDGIALSYLVMRLPSGDETWVPTPFCPN